jgi:hypothetical protein
MTSYTAAHRRWYVTNRDHAKRNTRIKAEGCSLSWMDRIPKLALKAGEVMHHEIDVPWKNAILERFPKIRCDHDKHKNYTMKTYMSTTPPTFLRELRMRFELLFCRPMQSSDHSTLHIKLKQKGKVNGR